ncbi:MAG TPA: enoyl-ACP reductase [Armatimonadota bacterium]|jgi:enoyl-[acyl-carrier protein] reductase I
MSGLLAGKTALVMGARNKWSIAWAIAQAYSAQGAKLALTYQGDREEKPVNELAESLGGALVMNCDVTDSAQVEAVFAQIRSEYGRLDAMVHAIAYAKREDLTGTFLDTSRDGFLLAMDVSVYSLVETAKHAAALMTDGGSIQTLTYLGGERVVPNYNVMGVAKAALQASVRYLAADLGPKNIRVNALSAGPIKTMAARGISDFDIMLHAVEERSPLRRNVTQQEVANASVFLASDLASAVTGETFHVDCGYHITAL